MNILLLMPRHTSARRSRLCAMYVDIESGWRAVTGTVSSISRCDPSQTGDSSDDLCIKKTYFHTKDQDIMVIQKEDTGLPHDITAYIEAAGIKFGWMKYSTQDLNFQVNCDIVNVNNRFVQAEYLECRFDCEQSF